MIITRVKFSQDHSGSILTIFELRNSSNFLMSLSMLDAIQIIIERSSRNGLHTAKVGRDLFNPYKVGLWLVKRGMLTSANSTEKW